MDKMTCDDYTIFSDVVKGRCMAENEMLYYNEYSGLVTDEFKLKDIAYCEVKNLGSRAMLMASKAVITIEFDLVFVYEYCNTEESLRLYSMYTEKVKKTICVEKRRFSNFFGYSDNLRCQCRVRDVRYVTDIDFCMTKLAISVLADIEYLILEKEMIKLTDFKSVQIKSMNDNTAIHDILTEDCLLEEISSYNDSNLLSRLSAYISYYMSKMMEVNQRLKEEIVQKDKLIALLENSAQSLNTERINDDSHSKQ